MQRTIVVRLRPTSEQAEILRATLEHYTACFNTVAREGFTTGCKNGVELHHRTYALLRAHSPSLPAQLVVSARVKATEAVTSALPPSSTVGPVGIVSMLTSMPPTPFETSIWLVLLRRVQLS